MMNEPLSQIMSSELHTGSPDDSLLVVKKLFKAHRLHHLPIVDEDGKLIGLITTSDLWKLDRHLSEYGDILIKDVMTTKLACLRPHNKIGSAAELFLENRFHAVPVVDDDKKLLGIITSFDVIKYSFLKEYPNHIF